MNYVSFWDAARFANWLHNGQPTGPQGPGTTEDGAYHDVGNQTLFGRNAGAKFFIPTEDEWYKAAYHKNDGVTGNYWDYPTASEHRADQHAARSGEPRQLLRFLRHREQRLHDRQPVLSHGSRRICELGQPLRHVRPRRQRVGVERNGSLRFVAWSAWRVVRRRLGLPCTRPSASNGDPADEYNYVGFRVASIPEPSTLWLAA